MDIKKTPLRCFIAAFKNKEIDPNLEKLGLSKGIISFSIPDLGIKYRCRAEGKIMDMEVKLFFALLEFIKTSLADEKIKDIEVYSSNPEFVFSFTPEGTLFGKGTSNRILLDQYSKAMNIKIGYIPIKQNQTLISAADYPSLPEKKKVKVQLPESEKFQSEYRPFLGGLKL